MDLFARTVVKRRYIIMIICLALLIPSVIGMLNTRINYDMLTYLPKDLDTVKGQDILLNDFGKGAFSLVLVENKTPEEVADLKNKIAAMRADSPEFARLMDDYDTLDARVRNFEELGTPVADETIEELKKERLLLKDRLYVMLRA